MAASGSSTGPVRRGRSAATVPVTRSAEGAPVRVYIDDCVSACVDGEVCTGWVLKTHEQANAADHADDLMTGDSDADADALSELMSDPLRAPVDPGYARVQWGHAPDPVVVKTSQLTVLDRPHLLGDTVAKAADPGGASGLVVQVKTSANLRFVVSGKELQECQNIELASKVCYGDVVIHKETEWAGFVRGAVFSVVVATEDNAFVYLFPSVSSSEPPLFQALDDDADPGICPHFAGQHICVEWSDIATKASCIAVPPEMDLGAAPPPHMNFVIKSVQLEEVVVIWGCSGPNSSVHPPAMIMPVAELEWLRLCDKGYRIGDYVQVFDVEGLSPASDDADRTARITRTVTTCRILWADSGVVEDRWIPSTELVPRPPTLTKDFGPLSLVVPTDEFITHTLDQARRATKAFGSNDLRKAREKWEARVGLVHSIDEGAQQCKVYWLDDVTLESTPRDDPGQDALYLRPGVDDGLETETMETYDVEAYDYVFLPGDIVERDYGQYDHAEDCEFAQHGHTHGRSLGHGVGRGERVDNDADGRTDQRDATHGRQEEADRCNDWIGQVLGISRLGLIRVRWHSGNVSMESPFDIGIVDTPEDDAYDDDYDGEGDEMIMDDEDGHDEEWTDTEDDEDHEAAAMSEDEDTTPETRFRRRQQEAMDTAQRTMDEAYTQLMEDLVEGRRAPPAEAAAAVEEEEPDAADMATSYEAFEVLENAPRDHAFINEPTTTISARVLGKEMRTLTKGLPQDGSIAIRGYEDRADLCRAVVFGPPETPYAGVPFFFDIFLPADYPKSPPKMLYWAGTSRDRLNPNLYENGKVCLSLLGTWNGPGWDPKTSSILQLLLSVQGLVLVDEPYFNEPGFEKLKGTAEGTRASKLYSENACVLALQNLISLWSRPPSGFKSVMSVFYKTKGGGKRLLDRCKTLVQSSEEVRSAGFARLLETRMIPKLEALFASDKDSGSS
eukprot:m.209416 g.209416  ORF g.209416 m.209416 type:complete len:957 (-) comp24598_c0_seq1:113-2983(-)